MFSVWCRMKQLACLMTAKYTLLLKGKDNFIYELLYTYTFYKHRIIIFILIALFSHFFCFGLFYIWLEYFLLFSENYRYFKGYIKWCEAQVPELT